MANSKANKSYLPSKTCLTCQRLFTWRKKWEKNWETIKYCSEKCRREKKQAADLSADKAGSQIKAR